MATTARRAYRKARSLLEAASRAGPRPAEAESPETARLLAPIGPLDPTQPSGPRVVLIDDCRDQVNFGASVLIDGLITILQKKIPNCVIVPLPSHWLMDVSGGFGAFLEGGAGLRQPWAPFPEMADQFESIADEWLEGRGDPGTQTFLDRFTGADLVVLNGEGSMYRQNQSAVRELFLAWLAKERLGLPTVFLNGTLHLTDVVPLLPGMVRKTFVTLDAVAVREAYSHRNLAHYAPGVTAQLLPDSAFVVEASEARESGAVAAVRSRIAGQPYFCFDPGAMHMDHRLPGRSALFELITRLQRITPKSVLVNSSPADGYIERIASETGAIYVDTIADYREYMALVASAEFAVTGRYHNPILAAIVGTPSVVFASSNHKVHGAAEMLEGIIGTPYDGTHLLPDLDAIVAQAQGYVEHRDVLRERLLAVCRRRRDEAWGIGELAASVLRR